MKDSINAIIIIALVAVISFTYGVDIGKTIAAENYLKKDNCNSYDKVIVCTSK